MRAGSVEHRPVADDGRQDPRKPLLEFGSSHTENVMKLRIDRSSIQWEFICFFLGELKIYNRLASVVDVICNRGVNELSRSYVGGARYRAAIRLYRDSRSMNPAAANERYAVT